MLPAKLFDGQSRVRPAQETIDLFPGVLLLHMSDLHFELTNL
jgi:hypothetical protein